MPKDTGEPESSEYQGGRVSKVQDAENVLDTSAAAGREHAPVSRVTGAEGGAKRGGFFKKRDYE
jgi:hypothetical protein